MVHLASYFDQFSTQASQFGISRVFGGFRLCLCFAPPGQHGICLRRRMRHPTFGVCGDWCLLQPGLAGTSREESI